MGRVPGDIYKFQETLLHRESTAPLCAMLGGPNGDAMLLYGGGANGGYWGMQDTAFLLRRRDDGIFELTKPQSELQEATTPGRAFHSSMHCNHSYCIRVVHIQAIPREHRS